MGDDCLSLDLEEPQDSSNKKLAQKENASTKPSLKLPSFAEYKSTKGQGNNVNDKGGKTTVSTPQTKNVDKTSSYMLNFVCEEESSYFLYPAEYMRNILESKSATMSLFEEAIKKILYTSDSLKLKVSKLLPWIYGNLSLVAPVSLFIYYFLFFLLF